MTQTLSRRLVLRSSIGLAAAAALGAAATPAFPEGATLLVGGPQGGAVDSWAGWLAPSLNHTLPPGTSLRKDVVGGVDGVTAANTFDARIAPDGSTALLLPGSAAMAWLVGDPRARFDVAHWIPALAGVTPGLLMSRRPITAGGGLRVAASGPTGPELPALLALDMLRVPWTPVFGLADGNAIQALSGGEVDAVCLHGRGVAEMVQVMGTVGARPAFSFGSVDAAGQRQRDPAFPQTPDASELLAASVGNGALRTAWRATAAAAELEVALVLPNLTPAAMVALWRHACAEAIGSDPVQEQASAVGVRPLGAQGATASTTALQVDAATQLALRNWLATRLNYRPT